MSSFATDTAKMIEMLPIDDQRFAYEIIKKLVLAWDPDYTKLTPDEAVRLREAENSGFILDEDIEWDKIGV